MTIDVEREDLVSLREAAESIQTKPAPSTLQRWRLYGVRGRKLETILIGGLRYTSKQAVIRFLSQQETAIAAPTSKKGDGVTPAKTWNCRTINRSSCCRSRSISMSFCRRSCDHAELCSFNPALVARFQRPASI